MIHPTRQGLRWFMVGLGVAILLWSSVLSVVLLLDHNQDLSQILALQHQSHVLGTENHQLLQKYDAEQQRLVAAGKEQAAFAEWLIEAQMSICQATAASCPVIPAFKGVS